MFTPHRAGKGKLIYADHYAMHFIMKGMPLKSPAMKKNSSQVIWNTNRTGGWEKYQEMTEHNIEFEKIVEDAEKMTSKEMMEKMEQISTKLKFNCFGKVKNSRGMDGDKDLELLYKEKCKAISEEETRTVETKIAEKLLKIMKSNLTI